MKMKALAAALMLMLLASCTFVPLAANADLLTAPILSREQAQVSEALNRILDISEIVYRYPQDGDHRSPIIFFDMDGDGLDEALVFYAYTSAPLELRLKILAQTKPDEWDSLHDVSGSGDEALFVTFAPIHANSPESLLIGWRNTTHQQTRLGVYTMRERFEVDFLERIDTHIIHDFDGTGTHDVLITQRVGDSHVLRLLSSRRGRLVEVASEQLYRETTAVLQLLRGRLWGASTGVYIDQRIDNSFYGT